MITGHLPELAIVMIIALIVFGPSRLPEVGNAVGKGLREFRRATSEIEDAVLRHTDDDEDSIEPDAAIDPLHVEPDAEQETVAVAPVVDTLAMRRAARQAAKAEPGDANTSAAEARPGDQSAVDAT